MIQKTEEKRSGLGCLARAPWRVRLSLEISSPLKTVRAHIENGLKAEESDGPGQGAFGGAALAGASWRPRSTLGLRVKTDRNDQNTVPGNGRTTVLSLSRKRSPNGHVENGKKKRAATRKRERNWAAGRAPRASESVILRHVAKRIEKEGHHTQARAQLGCRTGAACKRERDFGKFWKTAQMSRNAPRASESA